MRHLAYHAHGRTFALPSGQRRWVGACGQEHLATPEGFRPYVWNAEAQRVLVRGLGLAFGADGWAMQAEGGRQVAAAFFPEVHGATRFQRSTPTVSSLRVTHQETSGPADLIHLAYTLAVDELETEVAFVLGGSRIVRQRFTFRASRAGRYRLALDTDYAGLWTPQPVQRRDRAPGVPQRYALEDAGLFWAWWAREGAHHAVEEVAGRSRLGIGDLELAVGEERTITPDTWGPTGIAAEGDDGMYAFDNFATNGQYGDGTHYVETGQNHPSVYRFVPDIGAAAAVASIDAGTEIAWVNPGDNNDPGSVQWGLRARKTADQPAWPSPYGSPTLTTAVENGVGTATSPFAQSVESLVAELVEGDENDYEGAAGLGIELEETGGSGYWNVSFDFGSGTPAALTIVYTPAGGGDVELEVADLAVAASLDALALTQAHTLAPADLAVAPTLDAPTLSTDVTLDVAPLDVAPTLDALALTQAHVLAIADLAVAVQLDDVALVQQHVLAVADLLVAIAHDNLVLTQAHTLAIDDLQVGVTLEAVTLSLAALLEVADLAVAAVLDGVALTQAHQLAVQDLAVAASLDALGLVQAHVLTVDGLDVALVLDQLVLVLPATFDRAVFSDFTLTGPRLTAVALTGPRLTGVILTQPRLTTLTLE
jgi:hypothetical protein